MVMMHTQISSKHGEYIELMKFLTSTQMNLLEIINLSNERFQYVYNYIYASTNTHNFGEVILKIRNYYAKSSNKIGRYTIRYALLNLREEVLEALLTNKYNSRSLDGLNITTKCYPI